MASSDIAMMARGLRKSYMRGGRRVEALQGIDLTIPRGEIYGLLGPNGAGKSTAINIFAGLTRKTGGRAEVWGFDIDRDAKRARASLGLVPQELAMDPFFTPEEALDCQAGLFGVARKDRRTAALLEMMDLTDVARAWSRTLSGGMRRRLMIARAMAHAPPVLALDEPTAGVDVELRERLWEQARVWREQGVTVVLTTHYLEEAQALCDRIAIIDDGAVVADDDVGTLLARHGRRVARVRVAAGADAASRARLEALTEGAARWTSAQEVEVGCRSERGALWALDRVRAAGLTPEDLRTREADLHDVFAALTRRRGRRGDSASGDSAAGGEEGASREAGADM